METIHENSSGFCNIKAGCRLAAWSSEWQSMSSFLLRISARWYFRPWLPHPPLPSSQWFLGRLCTVTREFSFSMLYVLLFSHSSSEGTPATTFLSPPLWKEKVWGGQTPHLGPQQGFPPSQARSCHRQHSWEQPCTQRKRLCWPVRNRDPCRALHLSPGTPPASRGHKLDWGDGGRQEGLDFWCGFAVLYLPRIIRTLHEFVLLMLHCPRGKVYASEFKAHILPSRPLSIAHLTKGQASSNVISCLSWWMRPLSWD